MENRLRIKALTRSGAPEQGSKLKPTLSWPHLVALGIGGIVGTGIYTLIGVGADRAGPAVLLGFVIAGVVCACAALAYAELATMIPQAGGAYTYSYAALGEVIAWIIGWSLILEYSLVVSTVAVGWSGYAVGFLHDMGLDLPFWLVNGLHAIEPVTNTHGFINIPAIFIVFVIAFMLMLGTRESAVVNAVLVVVKIAALILFVVIALPHFKPDNLQPFMPYGFLKHAGIEPDGRIVERGVMAAAAIIFFAFYGFDTIATAAEETKNPKRDLSIGIIGSLIGCILIYILVGIAAVGAISYTIFSHSTEPLSFILRHLNSGWAAATIAAAAVIALPTVLLAFFYGQTRIFFVMGRDGLLPHALSRVSPKTGTPVLTTFVTAFIIAGFAGFAKLDELASLANAGTLTAFTAVGLCLLVLRVKRPDFPRMFRTPLAWVVGPLAIIGCTYLFFNLALSTQIYFLIWNVIGIVVYLIYSRRSSILGNKNREQKT